MAGKSVAAPYMRGRRVKRQGLWRLALLMVMLVIAALYVSPIKTYISRSGQIENERAATGELKQQHERLLNEKERLKQDEYVEQVARRELGLVRPGEQPFVVKQIKNEPASTAPPDRADSRQELAPVERETDGTGSGGVGDLLTRMLPGR